jgi:hypothetical protein
MDFAAILNNLGGILLTVLVVGMFVAVWLRGEHSRRVRRVERGRPRRYS